MFFFLLITNLLALFACRDFVEVKKDLLVKQSVKGNKLFLNHGENFLICDNLNTKEAFLSSF